MLLGVNGLWTDRFLNTTPRLQPVLSDATEGEVAEQAGLVDRQQSGNLQQEQSLAAGRADANAMGDGETLLASDLSATQLQLAAQQGRRLVLQRQGRIKVRYSQATQPLIARDTQTQINLSAAPKGDRGQSQQTATLGEKTLLTLGPGSKEDRALQYVEGWRRWMRANGNLFYPDKARRLGLRGEVITQVRLNSDGSLDDVSILRSSGQRLLDQAVLETTRAARWYLPFPAELASRYEQLQFSWRWRYGAAQ